MISDTVSDIEPILPRAVNRQPLSPWRKPGAKSKHLQYNPIISLLIYRNIYTNEEILKNTMVQPYLLKKRRKPGATKAGSWISDTVSDIEPILPKGVSQEPNPRT